MLKQLLSNKIQTDEQSKLLEIIPPDTGFARIKMILRVDQPRAPTPQIPPVGHVPMIEIPEKTAKLYLEFLKL